MFIGRIRAVQERDDRRPWAVPMSFDRMRVGGRSVAVPLEMIGVEARTPSDSAAAARPGGAPTAGSGELTGKIVRARTGAALIRRSAIQADNDAVVRGTASAPAALSEGARADLRATRWCKIPATGG